MATIESTDGTLCTGKDDAFSLEGGGEKDGELRNSVPIRNIENLFCSSVTIDCALRHNCVPCAYKIGCFDVALDSEFCKTVPNQRPEQCPRSNNNHVMETSDTMGFSHRQEGFKVLTVGDGDLSFSLAVALLLSRKQNRSAEPLQLNNLVATAYESKETLCSVYPNFEENASKLESLGVTLKFNVDATRLAETLEPPASANNNMFHRIIWNFPCTAIREGQDGQNNAMEQNKQLVREFVENARRFVIDGGEILMCHKTKPPFNQWRIEEVALELCDNSEPKVRYVGRMVLDRSLIPPYQPRKALHSKSFPCHDACFYVFRVSRCNRNKEPNRVAGTIPTNLKEFDSEAANSSHPQRLYPVTINLILLIREKHLIAANDKRKRQRFAKNRKSKKRRQR